MKRLLAAIAVLTSATLIAIAPADAAARGGHGGGFHGGGFHGHGFHHGFRPGFRGLRLHRDRAVLGAILGPVLVAVLLPPGLRARLHHSGRHRAADVHSTVAGSDQLVLLRECSRVLPLRAAVPGRVADRCATDGNRAPMNMYHSA
jgi:hypothetical protein